MSALLDRPEPSCRHARAVRVASVAGFLVALGLAFTLWSTGAAGNQIHLPTFHQDFRSFDPKDGFWRPINGGVQWEAEGARITLPAGQGIQPLAGLAPSFKVHGNFEITVSYEILKAERPSNGYGVGVSLYAALNPETNDAVSLAYRLMPDGKTVFMAGRLLPANGPSVSKIKIEPATAAVGKLRLQRLGSKVRFLVAEGDKQEFIQLNEVEFGTADVPFVQVGGDAGKSESGLDARFLDFTARAEELPGAPESPPEASSDPAAAASPQVERKGWLAAGVFIGVAVALVLALGAWLYVRQGRRDAGAARRAAPEALVLPCSACGKTLKAKAEWAGKKIKCPQCGQAAHVTVAVE